MLNRIARVWCRTMHRRPMWPIHGQYTCPQCLQQYVVAWEEPVAEGRRRVRASRSEPRPWLLARHSFNRPASS
jgi:hypothetical protein